MTATGITNWLLDFDETLASGIITWGTQNAFPKLVAEYNLPYDSARFNQAINTAQERASRSPDPASILNDLFDEMGWDRALQKPLMQDLQVNYRPALFDDTMPFLKWLHDHNHSIYVVSNNPRTPDNVLALGISPFVTRILTPTLCEGCKPKPDRSLWEFLLSINPAATRHNSAVVGDDPWSEGFFAENCELPCFIVDRERRLSHLHNKWPYRWFNSLLDIPVF